MNEAKRDERKADMVDDVTMERAVDPKDEILRGHVEYEGIDPAEEHLLVRKLDLVVMPLMAFTYFFQYLDKQTLNYAAIFGFKEDLNLTGHNFSWVVSIYYLGQLVSQWPAAYLLSRFPVTLYVGGTVIAWGATEMLLAAPVNFGGMMAVRFFLGVFEGSVSPAFIIITSLWYKRREHTARTAVWIAMNGVSQIIGALLMFGIGHASLAIASWRVLFLITGTLTIVCGIAFLLWMPKSPATAWFLSDRERIVATNRLAVDRSSQERMDFNKAQLKEALTCPTTYLYLVMALGFTLPTPIIKFSSTVINGFGFSKFNTMLVGLPSGVINSATVIVSALIPKYVRVKYIRMYTALFLTLVPLVGSSLMTRLSLDNDWGVVAATWLAGGIAGTMSASASLVASNVKGNTKKSVVSTAFFVAYCIGCLVAPQAWEEKDAPRYVKGCFLSVGALAMLFIAFCVYWYDMDRRNRARDRKAAEGDERYAVILPGDQATGTRTGVSLDSDMTDVEDKAFRYAL